MNDQGKGTVSDVIRACDWILANKATYNIQVANFSLHSASKASVMFDPLDQAVEKLWLNGVVVVAAAGNYGTGPTPSGVLFAPGNDPFVITVGATDIGNAERRRRRLRRAVVGVRLHAGRLLEAGPRRSRPLPDRAGARRPASCR